MSRNGEYQDPPGLQFFHENRNKFPSDELMKYAGLWIAWKADGTRILASGTTEQEMEANLVAMGINPNQVVGDYVDTSDGRF